MNISKQTDQCNFQKSFFIFKVQGNILSSIFKIPFETILTKIKILFEDIFPIYFSFEQCNHVTIKA